MWTFRRAWFFTLLLCTAAARTADAASLNLAWDPPVDALTTGYFVVYGTASGVYTARVDVGLVTTKRIDGLQDGTRYYFRVQAYGSNGEVSDYSAEIAGVTAGPAPSGGGGGGSTGETGGSTGGGGSSPGGTGESPAPTAGGGAPVMNLRDSRFIDIAWLPVGGATGYRVEIGTSPGHTAFSASISETSISFDTMNHPAPAYFARVRPVVAGTPGEPSQETSAAGAAVDAAPAEPGDSSCSVGPNPARQFVNTVRGNTVHLSWQPGAGPLPVSYLLEVGSQPGLKNLLVMPIAGASTGLTATAGNGIYAVRLASTNACGASLWAPEILLQVGVVAPAPSGPVPGQVQSFTHNVQGSIVTLAWAPPSVGGATRYLIEAQTPFGPFSYDTGNSGTIFTNAATPAGEYVITIRAGNAAGFGPASSPVTVHVP